MQTKTLDSFNSLIYSCKNNNNIAYKTKTRSISYDSFFNDVIAAQKVISHMFTDKNILLYTKPSYEWIVLYFGLQLAKKTTILIDHETPYEKLLEFRNKYNTSTVIDGFIKNNSTIYISNHKLTDKVLYSDTHKTHSDLPQISTVIFTSGTSDNNPKGVALSEIGLLTSAYYGHFSANIMEDDVILHTLPFHHAFGLAAEVIAPIMSKTTLCFGHSLGTVVHDINDFSATAIYTVPQIIQGLLPYIKRGLMPSLIKVTCGSAPLDKERIEEMLLSNIELHVSYGLSECSPCVAVSKAVTSYEDYYSGEILPCCSVFISDNNEICVSGTNVMLGYFDGTKLINNKTQESFVHTGDTGYIQDNKLYVTGRLKDILVFNNGKKYNKTFIQNEIIKLTKAKECFVFAHDDSLNIILYQAIHPININEIIEILPKGIKIGDIYLKSSPFNKTKLNKVINSHNLQLNDCKKIN